MNMTVSGSRLGTILRRERVKLGLSASTFAKRVGLSSENYTSLETGELRGPDKQVLVAIADQLPRNNFGELVQAAHRDRLSAASVAAKPKRVSASKLGTMIFKGRARAGMSLRECTANLGISPEQLQRLENGEVLALPSVVLIGLASNLGLDASEVLLAAQIDQANRRR